MDDAGRDPELAAFVLVNLHWVRAIDETRNVEGAKFPVLGPGDLLVDREFLHLDSAVRRELEFAQKASLYAFAETMFNPLFNDGELYTFVSSLYLARHFDDPVNRSAFLLGNQGFTEKQLLRLARRCTIHAAKWPLSPKLARLTNQLLETQYVTHQPAKYTLENEHLSPVLQRLRERQPVLAAAEKDKEKVFQAGVLVNHFRNMEEEIVNLYKLAKLGPIRHISDYERCREEQAFTLTQEQAERLLAAARVNGFFHDLVSSKPPKATSISHEQALCECAEHARLWLFNSRLPIYYNFSLTYADVAKPNAGGVSSEEQEVWSSPVGFTARLPSYGERHIRRQALAGHWDELENPPDRRHPDLHKVPECSLIVIRAHDLDEKLHALDAFLERQPENVRAAAADDRLIFPEGIEEIVSEASGPVKRGGDEEPAPGNKRGGDEEPAPGNKEKRKKRKKTDVEAAPELVMNGEKTNGSAPQLVIGEKTKKSAPRLMNGENTRESVGQLMNGETTRETSRQLMNGDAPMSTRKRKLAEDAGSFCGQVRG